MDKKKKLMKGNYDSDADDNGTDNHNNAFGKKDEVDTHADKPMSEQNMIEQF